VVLESAQWGADSLEDEMTSVLVQTKTGDATFALAVCDVFVHGVLTVSCSDPAHDAVVGPLRVFPIGTWESATTFDRYGNPLHTLRPNDELQKTEVA
jgi:hypothetical protein